MISMKKAVIGAQLLFTAFSASSQQLIINWSDDSQPHSLEQITQVTSDTGIQLRFVRSLSHNFDLVELTDSTEEVDSAIRRLNDSGYVKFIEPVEHVRIPTLPNTKPTAPSTELTQQVAQAIHPSALSLNRFNDPLFISQQYLDEQQAPYWGMSSLAKARDYASEHRAIDRKVRIGVLDTGSWPHEDMQWSAEQANLVSTDSTGEWGCQFQGAGGVCALVSKKHRSNDALDKGWFLAEDGQYRLSIDGHGLAVASQIAAVANNHQGMVGIMPHDAVELIPIRVLSSGGFGSNLDIAEGISWALGNHVEGLEDISAPVDIISMSLGGTSPTSCYDDSYTRALIKEAYEKGISVVIAAGNESMDTRYSSPGHCEQAFTVASNQSSGEISGFSNYGEFIDISAKGENVLGGSINTNIYLGKEDCTDPSGCYQQHTGTSMSTPNMAALLGLLKMVYPDKGAKEREAMIQSSARPALKASNGMMTQAAILGYGTGVANGEAAMQADQVLDLSHHSIRSRFAGYDSPAQQQYLQQLHQQTANACNLYDIELGWLTHVSQGVHYELFTRDAQGNFDTSGSAWRSIDTPRFSVDTSNLTGLAARACRQGQCGSLTELDFAAAVSPEICQ